MRIIFIPRNPPRFAIINADSMSAPSFDAGSIPARLQHLVTGFRALRSILTLSAALAASIALAGPRARDLGVPFEGKPGPLNAITDVAGVTVGQVTLIEDLADGRKVRTGVTAILPRGRDTITTPAFAGSFVLNGAGEMTGRSWIEESGLLEGPVMLTNTHSVGTVHEATIAWRVKNGDPDASGYWWSTPVVAETWDGELNDVNGFHVKGRARGRGHRRRESGPGRRGQCRWRHRHDLSRLQVRHRHGLAPRRREGTTADGRGAGAGKLRNALVAAHRGRPGRRAPARERAAATRPRPRATTARSSSSWRRTRR